MTHLVDEAQRDARAAIAAMQDAARHARAVHARAELLRHMRATAQKPGADPARVAAEWMQAWGMQDWPAVAAEMRRFSAAFCAYAATPDDAADRTVRDATAGLEHALHGTGTTLADEMARRSECRHGWWAAVQPDPPGQPFWTEGAAPHCGG